MRAFRRCRTSARRCSTPKDICNRRRRSRPRTAAHAAYQAATVMGDVSSAKHKLDQRAQTGVPDLSPPLAPATNTMRIATPMGYSSRPPRKMWPIVLVMGLLLGLGGGAFAVAWFGRKETPAVATTPTADDAPRVAAIDGGSIDADRKSVV